MNRPAGFVGQPFWTVLVPGRLAFTTSHLVQGEEIINVGTSIPVDVHPTRGLFRLVADPATGGVSR